MKIILKDFYSICVFGDNIYGIIGDELYSYNIKENSYVKLVRFDFNFVVRFIMKTHVLKRLLRYIPRAVIIISVDEFCFVLKNKLYKFLLREKKLVCLCSDLPTNPLNLTISHCEKYVIFGDYDANESLEPVNVNFVNLENGHLHSSEIFENGDVNHIHNILPYKNGYIVLTGDTGNKTGLYLFDYSFSSYECLFSNGQLFRSCWLKEIDDNFYFSTDSQYEDNFLIKLDMSDRSFSKIANIENSSIYSCSRGNKIYFSTTVEPGYNHNNFFLNILDDRIGNGITSRYARIYSFDGDLLTLVDKKKKDFLPMRLFQFGTFSFPDHVDCDDQYLIYNCLALSHFSGVTVVLNDM